VFIGYGTADGYLYFCPRVEQLLTEDQQDALVGSYGTPSSTNKYVTQSTLDLVNGVYYGADAGSTDTYAITASPAPSAYVVGDIYLFRANTLNTGRCTLNANSLGAVTIFKKNSQDLATSDITAKQMVLVVYDTHGYTTGTLDTYASSNYSEGASLNNTNHGIAQSFTGIAGKITSCQFHLSKANSPTGNAVAKLYAHTGTYGTSSKPTGTALATSGNFDVSTLTGTPTLTTFTFTGANIYEICRATNYVLAIEYTSGDASNTVDVGYDNSSPTHGGNLAVADTGFTWTEDATKDGIFVLTGEPSVKFEMLSPVAN